MSFDRYIASVSFGNDSLAMVLLILERGLPLDEVVFYDTGMEFKAIYDTRDKVLPILYDHGVKYTELRPPRPSRTPWDDGLVVRAVHRTRHREDGLPDEGSGRSGPGRRRSMATVKDLAAYVCDKLAGKVLIHRYDAYSTNSVYLKFDYGLGNSLRLSDHTGKAGLNYRFNIITTMKSLGIDTSGEYPRFYYPPDMVDQAIADIVKGVTEKRGRYHDYGKALETARARTKGERGFWEQARLVKGGEDHDVP